jgi:hypothetical protein
MVLFEASGTSVLLGDKVKAAPEQPEPMEVETKLLSKRDRETFELPQPGNAGDAPVETTTTTSVIEKRKKINIPWKQFMNRTAFLLAVASFTAAVLGSS